MKLPIRRVLCLILSFLLAATCVSVLPALTSCANVDENVGTAGTDTDDTDTGAVTEGPDETLDLPELSFGNTVFRVLDAQDNEFFGEIDVENGNTGEPVNDAIFERNRVIEALLDVRFEMNTVSFSSVNGAMERQVKSGATDETGYDLFQFCQRDAYSNTIAGYTTCFNKLEYFDMDKAYFFRTINEQCCFGGYPFFAYGADAINLLAWASCMVYNKTVANDLKYENLYDAVRNGEWTHEKLFTLAENAASDLDGDGKFKSDTDRFGLVGVVNRTVSSLWACAGEKLIVKDEEGMPAYNASGNDRFINILTNMLAHLDGDGYDVFERSDKIDIFTAGRAMFFGTLIGQLNTIRSMEQDYGLLPFPKYDVNQKEYISRSAEGFIHLVPADCRNYERTGAVLQALAYYSNKTVYDAYYEQALTTRFLRDADSVDMMKLILSTLTVDIGDSIWFNTISTPMLDTISSQKSKTGLSSLFKKYERATQTEIKKATSFLKRAGV